MKKSTTWDNPVATERTPINIDDDNGVTIESQPCPVSPVSVESNRDISNVPSALTNDTATTLTIEHNINTTTSSIQPPSKSKKTTTSSVASRSIIGVLGTSPSMIIAGLLGLSLLGVFSYSISQWIRIPSLQDEIDALESNVNRLESQVTLLSGNVTQLEKQNDEYEQLNDELNSTVIELQTLTSDLSEQNQILQEQLKELNETVNKNLTMEIDRLENENDILTEQNQILNVTIDVLSEEVSNLQNETQVLESQLYELTLINENITDQLQTLEEINNDLNESLMDLNRTVETITEQNNELKNTVDELTSVLIFLNETNTDESLETFDEVIGYLNENIEAYRTIIIKNLEVLYDQSVINWDCSYTDRFIGEPFINDINIPIGPQYYDDVIDFIDTRVLSQLCLNRSNVEVYLSEEYDIGTLPPTDISSKELVAGITTYQFDAFDYYFPSSSNNDNEGLTQNDWAIAEYDCKNLPLELQYRK